MREQNCSQMLRDWPLSAKIAKHDPQMRSFPFFSFLFSFHLSALRVVPRVLSSTCRILELHRGGFGNCAQLNVTNPLTNACSHEMSPFCSRDLPKSPGENYAKQIDHLLTCRDFVLREKLARVPKKTEQNNERTHRPRCTLHVFRVTATLQRNTVRFTLAHEAHTVLLLFINLQDRGLSGGQGRLPPEILRKCLISPRD